MLNRKQQVLAKARASLADMEAMRAESLRNRDVRAAADMAGMIDRWLGVIERMTMRPVSDFNDTGGPNEFADYDEKI